MGCVTTKDRIVQSQIFFNIDLNETANKLNNYNNYKTSVKLEFTIDGCEINHRYQIIIKGKSDQNQFSTENALMRQSSITFNTCYICDYYFERQQQLELIVVKDDDNLYATAKPTLGIIVGSPNSTYKVNLPPKSESIIITAQGINNTNSYIDFNFIINNKGVDFRDIKNKISYKIANRGRLVYQSESISSKGTFNPIRVPMAILEPDFTITFLNSKQEVLTFKDETIDSFTEKKNLVYLGFYSNNNKINVINDSNIYRSFSFVDYLKNGVSIKLTIGIDFTSNNLSPSDPNSFHYLGGGMNDYELAIRACGEIVAYYDYNQSFPVYGFGAVIKGQYRTNMCFNINFQKNPEINTIDNVVKEYHKCFQYITLSGPSEFCPLVQRVNEVIKKENDPLKYHILMILTDGIIEDLQKTIDALVEGSFLPLSVVIIGIGNHHFNEMIQLDGDVIPLVSSTGVKRMRDLVQFVPFNTYRNDPNELAAQVLEEIPRQIMEYYTMNNIYPNNLAMSQFNNNNAYANKNNTYNKYIAVTDNNNTYKHYLNMNYRNINSNSLEDEKGSKGTGAGSIYY